MDAKIAALPPELLPRCGTHGPMALVPEGGRSDLARWCGVWYECTHAQPRCRTAALIPSKALLAQLHEQQARATA